MLSAVGSFFNHPLGQMVGGTLIGGLGEAISGGLKHLFGGGERVNYMQ